jgi:hypothetical protein
MVLALLLLIAFDKYEFGARALKSHDWDALEGRTRRGISRT